MRVLAIAREGYETDIAKALYVSGSYFGIYVDVKGLKDTYYLDHYDALFFVSMTANREPIYKKFISEGKTVLYCDKSYIRPYMTKVKGADKTWRFSVDALTCERYIHQLPEGPTRWKMMGVKIQPKQDKSALMIAGSTDRHHSWYGLPSVKDWVDDMVWIIKDKFDGKIYWRPKPATIKKERYFEVPETTLDRRPPGDLFTPQDDTGMIVTHASAIVNEAVWAGVPFVAVGKCPAQKLGCKTITDLIETRYVASIEERTRWSNKLVTTLFTMDEIYGGSVWKHMRYVKEEIIR